MSLNRIGTITFLMMAAAVMVSWVTNTPSITIFAVIILFGFIVYVERFITNTIDREPEPRYCPVYRPTIQHIVVEPEVISSTPPQLPPVPQPVKAAEDAAQLVTLDAKLGVHILNTFDQAVDEIEQTVQKAKDSGNERRAGYTERFADIVIDQTAKRMIGRMTDSEGTLANITVREAQRPKPLPPRPAEPKRINPPPPPPQQIMVREEIIEVEEIELYWSERR